jgi:hypothetical protein
MAVRLGLDGLEIEAAVPVDLEARTMAEPLPAESEIALMDVH